jgi:hypothetical protein
VSYFSCLATSSENISGECRKQKRSEKKKECEAQLKRLQNFRNNAKYILGV